LDDDTLAPQFFEAIYMGQICELQWLRNLKAQIQVHDAQFLVSSSLVVETNFYLDDDGVQLLHQENPFLLPPENVAMVLLRCYLQTVHITFPLAPAELENQLQIYYHSIRNGHNVTFPQRWYGIVNVILAIGAQFSRLVSTERHEESLDETLYISRACQLLELGNTTASIAVPDLSLIQVSSRF
jgi:hypothetical protein